MTFGHDDPQSRQTPTLTRRELRERERAADAVAPIPGPSAGAQLEVSGSAQFQTPASAPAVGHDDGIAALFGAPTGGNTFVPPAPADQGSPFPFTPPTAGRAAPGRAPANTPIATNRSSSVGPKRIARTVGSRLLSLGALLFAGALVVGMSVPANAFYTPSNDLVAFAGAEPGVLQSVDVAANVESASATRDKWSVLSWAEVLRDRYGTRDFSYTPGFGTIRWPFPSAVPISSGFGERVAPCRGCSVHHMGIDLTPGNGAAIFAIADGVVIEHDDVRYGFGNHVVLQHQINGKIVTTTYAHMQTGSSPLVVGEEVKVGDFIGLVGQTGMATGPHLHLEITEDGFKVDPFAWLKANAN